MLTLFTIPKPFTGHIGLIQRNALASWRRLGPDVDIILLGADDGVAEAAQEFGARHEPSLPANEYGTPLISAAFALAQRLSDRPYLMYSNADMLYDASLLTSLRRVSALPAFLLSGQRWDHDIQVDLTAADGPAWEYLFAQRSIRGQLRGPAAMDFFIFPRLHEFGMPPFAVGRVGWDSWLVWKCRRDRVPVIDATTDIAALHQNHSYSSLARGCQHQKGPERTLNIRLAGGLANMLTLREASHELQAGRLAVPSGTRRWSARLATFSPYLQLLGFKRWVQQTLA